MYCRKCKYPLSSLRQERRCPECGCPFDPADPDSYLNRRDDTPAGNTLNAIAVLLPFILVAGVLLIAAILVVLLLWSLSHGG